MVTPVRVEVLRELLTQTNYNPAETRFLVNGFSRGFSIGYRGPLNHQDTSNNLPFTVGNKFELWDKIMSEVQLKIYAGPYEKIPFGNYIQSPVGLVPKAENKTRLIFHLSYKFKNGNESVNYWTPDRLCSVKYNDLDCVVKYLLKILDQYAQHKTGASPPDGLVYAKTDMKSAFRILPCSRQSWRWLILKGVHPITNKTYYFVDKNLAFGASISCSHFQRVSNVIRHILEYTTGCHWHFVNYLDDFLYCEISIDRCNTLVRAFLDLCECLNIPVSQEKMVWASSKIVFLGILILGKTLKLSVPIDKQDRALTMLTYLMQKKKATVGELERLAGFLNFLNKAVVPGRTFTRQMYTKFAGVFDLKLLNHMSQNQFAKLCAHHHVRLDLEFKNDCHTWILFLENLTAVCRPFVDFSEQLKFKDLGFYTDASKNPLLGFGATFGKESVQYTFHQWEAGYIKKYNPSIQYLELYALCMGLLTWGKHMCNGNYIFWCDNKSVRDIVNSG